MQIEDGKGRGHRAAVNEDNRALTEAVQSSIEHFVNHAKGEAYQLPFEQSPTAGNDCIFYMSNDDQTNDISIEGFVLSVDQACELYFQLNDKGTRNAATAIVPINVNAGSGKSAVGTFEQGADLDGGAATLDGGAEFTRIIFRAASNSAYWNFEQDIILPRNATLTLWCSNAAATVNASAIFNYHSVALHT